jgi:Spy/CpxP family protein refolding chaperone
MNSMDWLELTEEQQAEMTSLRTEHSKIMTPLKNKMAELKARERTLLSEENIDMKAVNNTIDEQTGLMNKIRKLHVEQQVAMKDVLTDEQLMKLQQRRDFAQQEGRYGKGGRRGYGVGRGSGKI